MHAIVDDVEINKQQDDDESLGHDASLIFPDASLDTPVVRYGYRVGSFNFLVPENTVSELIPNATIYPLPNSPRWITGLINIHGNIIPVVELSAFPGVENKKTKTQHVLAIGKYDNALAIVIDELPQAIKSPDSDSGGVDIVEELQDFVSQGVRTGTDQWYEFDIQAFFKSHANKGK